MPTPSKGPRLGGSPSHQRLLLSNLATALFEHGRITTTHAKAKALRPLAERLITFAKRGDIAARRQVLTVVRDKTVVHTLFAEIGPRFAERAGGYTRIVKVGPRKGDNAPMAVIELVEGKTIAQEAVGEAERARGTRFARRKGAESTAATEATEAETTEAEVPETEAADGAEPVEAAETETEAVADVAEAPEETEAAPEAADAEAAAEAADADADSGAGNQAESAGQTSQAEGEDDSSAE